MKIKYLELKNFSAIDNAMGCKHISIDFTKTKNRICLLIGPNGSGKTTILSLLNPFADLGNLDVRNSNNLILKDKNGYKEIHIQNEEDEYVVKHFYTSHKDKNHSVKSYIEKNGIELNENGNVTSFKEIVKEELQIEPDYLKLIRLGANVTSLIDLSSTERKNYMSKIMDDIGIYLKYYKAVNSKLRQLSEMISHTVDKINKLGVIDKVTIKKDISSLQSKISEEEKEFIKENQIIAVCENTCSSIDDLEHLGENLRYYKKKLNKMLGIIEKLGDTSTVDLSKKEKELSKLEKDLLNYENELKSNSLLIDNTLDHLNIEQDQLRSYKIQLQKSMEGDEELSRMKENQKLLRKRINECEDLLGDYKPGYSKEEFEAFVIFLKNAQQILDRTYEFGKKPVSKVIELMKKNKNVTNYVNSHLLDLDDEEDNKGSLFMLQLALLVKPGEDIVIDCSNECVAKNVFNQIKNLLTNSNVTDKKEDSQFYKAMDSVYHNILLVLPRFIEFKSIIDSLPEDIQKDFSMDKVYENICKLKYIYDANKINDLLSLVTEYYNYLDIKDKYSEGEELIKKFSSLSKSGNLSDQVSTLEESVEKGRDKIFSLKERNVELKELIDECNKSIEIARDEKETIEKFDEIKERYEKLQKDDGLYQETEITRRSAVIRASEVESRLKNDKELLKGLEEKLTMYKSLTKELSSFNSIYDNMTYVKESLSAKKGIPLHIISDYLNNTEEITNELLDIAYDGRIFIDNFNITPTEFSIPFYNNGVRLEDVKYASQGELSFLSIALAFALASQSLSRYNIMLLDEMDGGLDTKNKEKFIRILENQIDRISCEQCFLITHNNMFSAYPVDIIDLSGENDSSQYQLANFIKIKKR